MVLEHEAHWKKYGYRIRKDITLEGDALLVTTTLTNLGVDAFSTVWYSHHFFSCNGRPIGPGYEVALELNNKDHLLDEPGAGVWSEPLAAYAAIERDAPTWITVKLNKEIEPGTRVKAEFTRDDKTKGSFTIKACHTKILEELLYDDTISMNGFNLYMEQGTLSPEPQLLIHLEPSHSKSWTQRLVFSDQQEERVEDFSSLFMPTASALGNPTKQREQTQWSALVMVLVLSMGAVALVMQDVRRRRYIPLPNANIMNV